MMSSVTKSCTLKYLKDSTVKINLADGEAVYLGRNELTTITDTVLSRKQIEATANYEEKSVQIKTLGTNYSGCNGYALRRDGIYQLKHGDQIELLLGNHKFVVEFDPEPEGNKEVEDEGEPKTKLAKLELSDEGSAKIVDDVTNQDEWESVENGNLLIYTCAGVKSQNKVAAFDLDGTIIKVKSGARFPKNFADWVLNFPEVTKKIKSLHNDDFKIVIFTNQAGIKQDKTKVQDFKKKIESVLAKIAVPAQVFVATNINIYRKPAPGMWNALCNEKNKIEVDISKSFYVGDAAGREKNWAPKKNKDHSHADRLFAINIGLKFYTPEEYFLGARTVSYQQPKFDPRNIPASTNPQPSISDICEVILMVGGPGSGKSRYCEEHLLTKGYAYANRDKLGSWQVCTKAFEKALQAKQSVVVDNTNGDKISRKRYIDIAKKYKVQCRCFLMTTTVQHCKHNNRFRELTDKSHAQVSDIIINMYKKQFEEPSLDEGFDEIVQVDFVQQFRENDNEALYKMFLLDN